LVSEKVVEPFVMLEVMFPLPARVKAVPEKPLIVTLPLVEVTYWLPFTSTALPKAQAPVL
jgi:hypothetical protein